MEPEQWRRIEALVAEALERDEDERGAFLDAACGDQGALRAEIEGLVRAAETTSARDFLERPAADALPGVPPDSTSDLGRSVGPYRLVRILGRGGMGVVYLAERADEAYQGKVALKLLHPIAGDPELARRLTVERQILAGLEHPGITRLLDGGTTEDGRPYLVMELVEGEAIDVWCDRHQLDVDARLRLFLQVCNAVAYAHRSLVVHRDLKPSNILVSEDGHPKLLDFGIAKLLDPAAFPNTLEATRAGVRLMSPSFASPEQLRGRPVTTASDVYSLGVLLYRLLTGRQPREFPSLAAEAVEHALREEPTRPSARVAHPGPRRENDSETVTFDAGSSRRLRRRLEGDLDAIVLKALREEPERRYGTVAELAEDLERHLAGLPVRARRGTFRYRAGKFLRRHRVALAAATLAAAVLTGFVTTTVQQSRRIARERDKAEAVAQFMAELFEGANPRTGTNPNMTVREAMDLGAERLQTELDDRSTTRAALLHAIGRVYAGIGAADQAEPLLRESLELFEEHEGEQGPSLAGVLNDIGYLQYQKGDLEAAKSTLSRALEVGVRALGPDDDAVGQTLAFLGMVAGEAGDLETATSYAERSLQRALRVHGRMHFDTASALSGLGEAYRDAGRTAEAEQRYLEALEVFTELRGANSEPVASVLNSLGLLYWKTGRLEEAASCLERAVAIGRDTGQANATGLGIALHNLGSVLAELGRFATAEAAEKEALELKLGVAPETSLTVAASRNGVAFLLMELGRLEEAQAVWRQVLATCVTAFGDDHLYTLATRQYMALIDQRMGKDGGDEVMNAAFETLAKSLPANHPELANALGKAAEHALVAGHPGLAAERLRRALEILAKAEGASPLQIIVGRTRLAEALLALGRPDEAAAELDAAGAILDGLRAAHDSPVLMERAAAVALGRARVARARGDAAQAGAAFEETLELLAAKPDDSVGARHLELKMRALEGLGRESEARAPARRLYELGFRVPEDVVRLGRSG